MRQHHRVGAGRTQLVHDFFYGHDGPGRGQHHFFLDAYDALDEYVSRPVRALGMDDADIGAERRDGGQLLARKRAFDEPDVVMLVCQIDAHIPPQDRAGEPGGAGSVGIGHGRVAVLFQLQRLRPALLDSVSQSMERAHSGIASPGKDQLAGTAHTDELVVNQVGSHTYQRQVAPALPDDLVPGRERNQVSEALHGHRITVSHILCDRVGQ